MPEDTVNVAVLSLNGMNRSFAEAFHANPRAQVVAVTEDDPPPATARTTPEETQQGNYDGAEEFGVPFVADLDAVLDRADVDAVTITSPFDPPGGAGREGRLGRQAHLHRQADNEHAG